MIGGIYFAGAYFAGLLGLGVTPPTPGPIDTTVGISIGGADVTARVRKQGVTIHDILNDAPNTASLVVEGAAPAVGQSLRITLNAGAHLLFAGQVQTVDQSFGVDPAVVAWAVTAIDDTAQANARRPFGTWVTTSATTIAQAITETYAPGFSAGGIAGGLPAVSIIFDGADPFIACLTRLASLIGGYAKIEDHTVYLFQVDTTAPPDPIDATHRFLFDPPISAIIDSSQLRTRVYGKGYGESITADLLAGETLVPIENGAQFPPAGQAIAGTKADAAQSEKLAYTGRELSAGGTLVGPGAAPTTAPGLSLAGGTGVESGVHDYAFVYVTAAGRSLPSPRAAITVGALAPPPTALTANPPISGPGNQLTPGSHRYYVLFRTATGTTLPGPVSNSVTAVGGVGDPGNYAGNAGASGYPTGTGLTPGVTYHWRFTFRRDSDGAETALSVKTFVLAGADIIAPSLLTGACNVDAGGIVPPAGYNLAWYRSDGGASYKRVTVFAYYNAGGGTNFYDGSNASTLGAAPPSTNTTARQSSQLTNIPVSASPLVTHVDLYREFNNAGAATARFLTSQVNGTTSIYDGLPNASLGGLMPSSNTTTANQVNVTWPAGPTAVTNIELFRTPIGSTELKKFAAAAGNAAGSVVDATPDASLTTTAPTSDTSGLTQPSGQVNPGAPALPVASTSPFRAAGGWVALAGDQVVRYTGITGSTLSGIPAAGAGAITTTVIYGAPAIPAPMLTGVTGITGPYLKGAALHLWVQRDDLDAQAQQAARAGGDGIVEHLLVDTRRGLDSLVARCDADLARFARPLVTVAYATRDIKTKSGKPVVIDLASPAIHETLTIQDVTITDIDQVPGVAPRYTVTASSVRFSLEDTLRRLIAGGQIVGGST
jgi:hypothetical protein